MNTSRFVLVVLTVFASVTGIAISGEDQSTAFVISENSIAKCAIVVKADAESRRRELAAKGEYNAHSLWLPKIPEGAGWFTPAEELRRWVERIADVRLDIQHASATGPRIVVGTVADFPELAREHGLGSRGDDSFAIISSPQRLLVLGATEMGLQNAVFYLLNELGCRWLAPHPDWITVPELTNLAVAINVRKTPAFLDRRIWWGGHLGSKGAEPVLWQKGNGLFSDFRVYTSHAWPRGISKEADKQRPEYFALVKGKRQPPQLCVSNPNVQRLFAEATAKVPERFPDLDMVSVEPADGNGYCECDECKKIGSGSISDQVVFLANIAARAVKAKHTDIMVGLLAYASHAAPPTIAIDPNVFIEVTTGYRWTALTLAEQVAAYRKQGAQKIGIYDYTVSQWAGFRMPGASCIGQYYRYAHDVRLWHELGIVSFTGESDSAWLSNGPGFWMLARWLWDPDLKAETLVDDFCTHAFGKAAAPMRRIYDRWALDQRPTREAIESIEPWDPTDSQGLANRYGMRLLGRARTFSPRQLKLGLLDVQEAYRLENRLGPQRRIDHVAMFLHSLRLWLDFYQSGRASGKKIVGGDPDEILEKGRTFYAYALRYAEQGLNRVPGWFAFRDLSRADKRFANLGGKELVKQARELGLPSHEDIVKDIADDLEHYADVPVVEIEGRKFDSSLAPAVEAIPDQVRAWGEPAPSTIRTENSLIYFPASRGETVTFSYKRKNVDCAWQLLSAKDKKVVAEATLKGDDKPSHTVSLGIPADGVYMFRTGNSWPYGCVVELSSDRPHGWRGGNMTAGMINPVYFYVPPETKTFLVRYSGYGINRVELKTADGETVVRSDRMLPSDTIPVIVPAGKAGQIWQAAFTGSRAGLRLLDIPNILAACPQDLLIHAGKASD